MVDWSGAHYQNGMPLPYTPDKLAALMRKDEMLKIFISAESEKTSSSWRIGHT